MIRMLWPISSFPYCLLWVVYLLIKKVSWWGEWTTKDQCPDALKLSVLSDSHNLGLTYFTVGQVCQILQLGWPFVAKWWILKIKIINIHIHMFGTGWPLTDHWLTTMGVAWRSGRVSDFHARDLGSIPGLATSRPTQAFHPSNLWVVDKLLVYKLLLGPMVRHCPIVWLPYAPEYVDKTSHREAHGFV